MPTGIQIDSTLTLNTTKAEKQLQNIVSGVKPVSVPVSFESAEIERKVAELKKVTFDWVFAPQVEMKAIDHLQEIIGEIQADSKFKITPELEFEDLTRLQRNIEQIKSLANIDIATKVDFTEVEKLKKDFEQLYRTSQIDINPRTQGIGRENLQSFTASYLRRETRPQYWLTSRFVPPASQADSSIPSIDFSGEELVSIAKEQIKQLEVITEEQRNTQATIKAESSTSLANLIKGRLAESALRVAKDVAVEEFNIDLKLLEKTLKKILPSTKIVAGDIKDFADKLTEFSGTGKAAKKLVSELLVGFADATAGADSIEDIATKFKKTATESFGTFAGELEQSKQKLSSLESVLKALGLSSDQYLKTLIDTQTGRSTARSLSRALDKPLAERKERIQTERLGNVLARAEELINQPVKQLDKQSAKLGKKAAFSSKNALAAVDEQLEELLLIIGGYADSAKSGLGRAAQINDQLKDAQKLGKSIAVGIQNPDTFKGKLPKNLAVASAIARPNIRGYSRDAEEIAAQAIAALTKNADLKVKLVGESGGGFAVEEAIQILNKLGFGDRVRGAGFGTPSFKAKASNPQNFTPYLGVNAEETLGNEVKNFYSKLGFVDPSVTRKNPKVSQDLKGLEGHPLENYFDLAEFRSFVLDEDDGRKQVRASAKKIKEIREQAVELAIKGAASDVIKGLEEFEKNTRITGNALQPFERLKQDIQEFQTDVDKGILSQLKQYELGMQKTLSGFDEAAYEGNVNFFRNTLADVPKIRIALQKMGLDSSKITQQVIDKLEQDLTDLEQSIPHFQSPELLKGDYIRRKTDDILNTVSDLEPEEAIATITDIEPTIKEYLAKIRELDNSADKQKVQAALENQLKTIKSARKLALLAVEFDFKELIKNPGEYLKIIKDSSLAKAKEAAKKKSLSVAQELATKANQAVDNFVEDFKDRLLEAVEIVKSKALPGAGEDTPLLSRGSQGAEETSALAPSGKGEITKATPGGIVKGTGEALAIRAIADLVVTGKNTYGALQKIEQAVFDVIPLLKTGKGIAQTAAPVIGGVAIASQSPELAALAKMSAHELATVLEPLLMAARSGVAGLAGEAVSNIPGIGGGARAAIQFLLNNSALNAQVAQGAGAITAYGALGGGAGAIAKAGAKLAGRKTFEALPESLKDRITPEAITAFDALVATRQAEIKQLAGGLNKEIAALKAGGATEGTQKLLAGYQQLDEEIQELETAVGSSSKAALKRTRDRIAELKGIQKGIRKALNNVGTKISNTVESIFDVEIEPINDKNITKKTLKKAIAAYKDEIIKHRKKLEKKILDDTAVDSDFQAGAELARRGEALATSLKQRPGFSREARSLSGVSKTLAGKIPAQADAVKAGDEVINGILKGTNQKLATVFIQGRTLGIELLDGFKQELEIKSPSGKFSKQMSDVAAGIVEGRMKERDRIRQAGEDIGQDLFDGSKLGLADYKDLLFNLEDLIQRKGSLQSSTYQQAFDFPDSDISEQLAQINQLESEIQAAADALAAFYEVQENKEISLEVEAAVDDSELTDLLDSVPDSLDIDAEAAVDDSELTDLLDSVPDSLDIDAEAAVDDSELTDFLDSVPGSLDIDAEAAVDDSELTDFLDSVPDSLDIDAEAAVDDSELTDFLDSVPDSLDIDAEAAVDDSELTDFLGSIPDGINLDVEADTGRSDQRLNRLDRNLESVRKTAKNALKALIGFGVLQISSNLSMYFEDIIRQSIETQVQFEQLETSIEFVAGSAEEGAKALEFVGQTARKLRIDLAVATEGYKQLAAAARNTGLESETERIFTSVAQASRVFGLSAEQTEGAILAVTQMISKGSVQAEELRGQLGERIPGAFQIAARAMNVTTQELGKLLETGQVTAEEFLPKFARQLESETRGGVTGAIQTTGAALQELRSSYTQFQLEIAKTTKPAQIALFTTLADALILAKDNLGILLPAFKILTATLITLFLPAIVSLGSLLKGVIVGNFDKLLNLLVANNAALTTMGKVARVAGAALGAFVVVEAISQAIALTQNLNSINREARDAVKDLDAAYQRFLENLAKNRPSSPALQEDIVQGNIERIKSELSGTAKFLDRAKQFQRKIFGDDSQDLPEFGRRAARTFAEAAIDEANSETEEAIEKANENLANIPLKIGTDIKEVETKDLQNAIDTINDNIASLEAQDPTTIETLQARNEAIQQQNDKLKEYNDELKRRNGLERTLAEVEVKRRKAVDEATETEVEALNQIDRAILKSGDLKRDVELDQLRITEARITAELNAEKQALAEFESIVEKRNLEKVNEETSKLQEQFDNGAISAEALAQGIAEIKEEYTGIDPDSGFLKGLSDKEIEAYAKRRDRVIALEREAVESKVSLAEEEVATKLRIYDEFLEEVEDRRQRAEETATIAEKERLIDIQQLVNEEVISTERAEELKAESTKRRITSQLEQEKSKLRELKKFTSSEVEVQEKRDADIMASRQKLLDLTLQLLQQEKEAEEKTIADIAKARNDAFSTLEKHLSRLEQLQQTETSLASDRATAQEKLADLQIAKLRQALELRKQLNSGDLNARERQTALRQLHSIGIDGRTDELSLLDRIEDREKKLAQFKLDNLEKQQQAEQAKLDLENQKYILAVKTAKLEAEKGQREAKKELISAEQAVLSAETDEELETANKLYELAKLNLDIANLEAIASKEQLNELDNIVKRKKENLALSQAIARAELKGTTTDEEFDREQERNQLRGGLSRNERIEEEVESRKEQVASKGGEFTSEDEAALRKKLERQYRQRERNQEFNVKKSLRGSPGFGIEAPPEILDAIRNGKPFTVPVVPKFKTDVPLEVGVIGKTKGSLNESNMILKTLQKIESKVGESKVINVHNDNQFINKYDKSNTDELIRRVRSEMAEGVRSVAEEF